MKSESGESLDLEVINPDRNVGYLPMPIPVARDLQISDLLSQAIESHSLARLQRSIREGHALVLRAFAERKASAAVRTRSATELRLGLIALLIALGRGDSRDGLAILPLFKDAVAKLDLDAAAFTESVREYVGDATVMPFRDLLRRSDVGIDAMGYSEGADKDGFRYVRNW